MSRVVAHPGFGTTGGLGVKPPAAGGYRGLGAAPPASNDFLRFLKQLILAQFFIEKGRAVSAVTIDKAKLFSQLMSKSGSLAKISEMRLQPLLV